MISAAERPDRRPVVLVVVLDPAGAPGEDPVDTLGPVLAEVTRHLGAAGGRTSPAPAAPPDRLPRTPRLTDRERQVLELVADGLTNRMVGRRLGITEKTASVHVSNLMAKLCAASRGEAVARARREGLLADDVAAAVVDLRDRPGLDPRALSARRPGA